jgi:hypothetical protein
VNYAYPAGSALLNIDHMAKKAGRPEKMLMVMRKRKLMRGIY